MSDLSNRLMVQSGGNLVRWMHVTPWKQDVESCDRVGLIQAMPAGDSESDVTGRRWEQRVELMRDAIIYHRNNPSILFYEAGNQGVSEAHMTEMKALRDLYDPHGGRAAGCREMLASKAAEYGGEMLYINKSAQPKIWASIFSAYPGRVGVSRTFEGFGQRDEPAMIAAPKPNSISWRCQASQPPAGTGIVVIDQHRQLSRLVPRYKVGRGNRSRSQFRPSQRRGNRGIGRRLPCGSAVSWAASSLPRR